MNNNLQPNHIKITQQNLKTDFIKITQQNLKTDFIMNQVSEVSIRGGCSPYIGSNGNWWQYDDKLKEFVDTKVYAGGSLDYQKVLNKPKLNQVTIDGQKKGEEYGLVNSEDYIINQEIYDIINS